MRSFRLFLAILLVPVLLFALVPRSKAQTLPDCPWPVSSFISATVTYTLTGNCKVTGAAQISGSSTVVTINGGGYTVDASALTSMKNIIRTFPNTSLVVNNITFVGGGSNSTGALHLGGDATISNATFRDVYRTAIVGSSGTGGNYTLMNILVENVTGIYSHYHSSGTAINANNNAVFTINNLVVRNALGGNAAISIFPNSGVSITMTGCFTADGVWPQAFYGGVNTGGITGMCSGSIGNGDAAARQYSSDAASACGLPLAGFIEADAVYNLSADCQMTGPLYVINGPTVTINGNGHSITSAGGRTINTAGRLTIRNAILTGGAPIVGFQRNLLRVENTTFRANTSPILLADHDASFENTLFEDNAFTGGASASRASVIRILRSSAVTIRDSVFRGNSGGQSAIYVGLPRIFSTLTSLIPSLSLEGCVTLENNSPVDIIDSGSYLSDNSTGPCDDTVVIGPPPPPGNGGPSGANGPSDSAFWLRKRVQTCPDLAPEILVTDLTGSTQCQRIGPAGVGRTDVLAAGLVDAVDVWSWVGNGTRVCFQASGAGLIFRDSAYPPPPLRILPAYRLGDLTCAEIDTAGSVMLLNSVPAGLPPLSIKTGTEQPLSACMVTLRVRLNLRREPGGELIRAIPANITLTALARTANWFEIDYHGQRGWVSAHYVDERGECA